MSKRTLGIVLMVVGVVAVIVSLAADALGIGADAGLGWKQALGAVVGVIIVAVGAWYWPGFSAARMMAEAAPSVPAASQTPRKSVAPAARGKSGAVKKSARPAPKKTARGSRRRGRR